MNVWRVKRLLAAVGVCLVIATAAPAAAQLPSDGTAVSSIGTAVANDADQNRVFVGLTVGYPIRID